VLPYAVEDLGGRSLVVRGDGDGRAVGGEHDPELAVDAVHAPGAVAGASPCVQAVGAVVGFGAAGVGRVRGHSGDVGGWNQALAVVGALVQEQLRDAGDFRGPELEADRSERVAEGATVPLGIPDAEGGEEAGQQEFAQVPSADRTDDTAEEVGVGAAVIVGRAGLGDERGGEEVAGRVAGMIAVVVCLAVGVARGHAEQVADGDLLAAWCGGVG